jgi:TetR/AcrR family transcriptional repressor of mexJK operon
MDRQLAGRPRGAERDLRYNALLDSAKRLFLECGYDGASLAAVAGDAHAALRTIYAWFGGKSGMLHAILEREGRIHARELDALDLGQRPFIGRLTALAQHFLRRVGNPALRKLHVLVAATGDPVLLHAFQAAGPGQIRDAFHALLYDTRGECWFRADLPIELLCRHFLGSVSGAAMALPEQHTADMIEQQSTWGLRLFLDATLSHEGMARHSGTDGA